MAGFIQNLIDERTVELLDREHIARLLTAIHDLDIDEELASLDEGKMNELVATIREKVLELAKK